jgi:hypothetical protein
MPPAWPQTGHLVEADWHSLHTLHTLSGALTLLFTAGLSPLTAESLEVAATCFIPVKLKPMMDTLQTIQVR